MSFDSTFGININKHIKDNRVSAEVVALLGSLKSLTLLSRSILNRLEPNKDALDLINIHILNTVGEFFEV